MICSGFDDHARRRGGAKGYGEPGSTHLADPAIRTQAGTGMGDEAIEPNERLADGVTAIIAAYVSNNRVPQSALPALIESVARSLTILTTNRPSTVAATITKPTKAEIEKSIGRDGIVSFSDGKTYRTLRRHLGRYGHTPQSYRMRYGLPVDYPMVAPSYSERRTELSRQNSARQRQLAAARKLQ